MDDTTMVTWKKIELKHRKSFPSIRSGSSSKSSSDSRGTVYSDLIEIDMDENDIHKPLPRIS
jgi:hypothetical protein